MTKHYCDRCGQLCNGFKKHGKYTIRETDSFCSLDLCNECQKELEDWMDNKTNINNQSTKSVQEQLKELMENTPEPNMPHTNPAKDVKSPLLPVKKIFGLK